MKNMLPHFVLDALCRKCELRDVMQTLVVNLKGAYHNLAATPPLDAVNGAAELGVMPLGI